MCHKQGTETIDHVQGKSFGAVRGMIHRSHCLSLEVQRGSGRLIMVLLCHARIFD